MNNNVKYPEVQVRLVGEDGNAFAILGRVTEALEVAGHDKSVSDAFTEEATQGSYGQLLNTVSKWVTVV